eukprot:224733-Pyramimonas_sp.AAC.1
MKTSLMRSRGALAPLALVAATVSLERRCRQRAVVAVIGIWPVADRLLGGAHACSRCYVQCHVRGFGLLVLGLLVLRLL